MTESLVFGDDVGMERAGSGIPEDVMSALLRQGSLNGQNMLSAFAQHQQQQGEGDGMVCRCFLIMWVETGR